MASQPSGEFSSIGEVGQGVFDVYSLVGQAADLTVNAISAADNASQNNLGFTEVPYIISEAVYKLQQAYEAQVEACRQMGAYLLAIGFNAVDGDPSGLFSAPTESDGTPVEDREFLRELKERVSNAAANAPVAAMTRGGKQTVESDEKAQRVQSFIDPEELDAKIWIVSGNSLAPNVVEVASPRYYRRLLEMALEVCISTWDAKPTADQAKRIVEENYEHEIAHWNQASNAPGLRRALGVELVRSQKGDLAFTPHNRIWGVCTKRQFLDIHTAPEHPSHSDRTVAGG